jgi:hypothetical protein
MTAFNNFYTRSIYKLNANETQFNLELRYEMYCTMLNREADIAFYIPVYCLHALFTMWFVFSSYSEPFAFGRL